MNKVVNVVMYVVIFLLFNTLVFSIICVSFTVLAVFNSEVDDIRRL